MLIMRRQHRWIRPRLRQLCHDFSINMVKLHNLTVFFREPKKALAEAHATIAECIGSNPDDIFFTSGGTESDNWAIKSSAFSDSMHIAIITSSASIKTSSQSLVTSLFSLPSSPAFTGKADPRQPPSPSGLNDNLQENRRKPKYCSLENLKGL